MMSLQDLKLRKFSFNTADKILSKENLHTAAWKGSSLLREGGRKRGSSANQGKTEHIPIRRPEYKEKNTQGRGETR
jgi:hypothetical protein